MTSLSNAKRKSAPVLPVQVAACLFDLDGVLTSTTQAHASAWKEMFDAFLTTRRPREGERLEPFDRDRDYACYVDGRLREDGVRSFLAARNIVIPEGSAHDAA